MLVNFTDCMGSLRSHCIAVCIAHGMSHDSCWCCFFEDADGMQAGCDRASEIGGVALAVGQTLPGLHNARLTLEKKVCMARLQVAVAASSLSSSGCYLLLTPSSTVFQWQSSTSGKDDHKATTQFANRYCMPL